MSENTVRRAHIVFLSYEDGKPTLHDGPGEGRIEAAWLDTKAEIVVSTDPEAVASCREWAA